jgi:hypothetical protein
MFPTFMSTNGGGHINVAFQHPQQARLLYAKGVTSQFKAGDLIRQEQTPGVLWKVLAYQICTHNIMLPTSVDSESSITVTQNIIKDGYTIWYLMQRTDNDLEITWHRENGLKKSKLQNFIGSAAGIHANDCRGTNPYKI